MRTCIYDNGDIIQAQTNCPDPFTDLDGNPIALVDWSDSIDVVTSPPSSPLVALFIGGILLMIAMGDMR